MADQLFDFCAAEFTLRNRLIGDFLKSLKNLSAFSALVLIYRHLLYLRKIKNSPIKIIPQPDLVKYERQFGSPGWTKVRNACPRTLHAPGCEALRPALHIPSGKTWSRLSFLQSCLNFYSVSQKGFFVSGGLGGFRCAGRG
jgi:hypothetical protein